MARRKRKAGDGRAQATTPSSTEAQQLLQRFSADPHAQLLKQTLRLMVQHRADAEDAASIALLRVLEVLPDEGHRIARPRAWLYRLVHNICMDLHRAARRHERYLVPLDGEPDELPLQPEAVASAEELWLEGERLAELERRVAELPDSLRQPFTMRFEDGRPYRKIAEALGLTESNARKRVQLACDRLRAALALREEA